MSVKDSPLPLAERGGYLTARNHGCILVFRFSAVVVSDRFSSTVVSRREKAAAFSERQRRVVHALVTFQKRRGSEKPKACRDRSPQTADAGEKRRHGQPSTLVFVYKIATERRRTELPRASAKRERSPGSEQRNREIFLMFKEKRRQQKKRRKAGEIIPRRESHRPKNYRRPE